MRTEITPAIPAVIKTNFQWKPDKATELVPMLAKAVCAIDFTARIKVFFSHFKNALLSIVSPSFTEYERRNKSGDENTYYIERTFSQLKFQEF